MPRLQRSDRSPATGSHRGMVTVELVCGILIVMMMLAFFGWAISLFGTQAMCIDAASDIARQAARGDKDAVRRETASAPTGSTVDVDSHGQEVTVIVKVTSKPFDFVPAVTLQAQSTAVKEPGS
ncbi:TadE family type IV pilus minor pilin [Microlunatus soli]|uniref:TadE-like protein n=1 Tax=Microlunatus soli TaxID=630515 RepID=A0A1H1SZC3_9ACTN|nr:TadE family type IV pilus minor pilin [Microlunatus soli]SDS52749.1 hypothetical protein SAMN04489812_2178 [Microlunatus soli]